MLAPPKGLTEDALAATLSRGWGIEVAGLEYRAVGFGSHHWEVVEAGGARWFVTVDELARRRGAPNETNAQVQARLAAGIGAARALRNIGERYDFVVAPIPSLDGAVLIPAREGFCVAVYPLLEGESFRWGGFRYEDQLPAVVAMVIDVHSAPPGLVSGATVDDFGIRMRGELDEAVSEGTDVTDHGPYSVPLGALITHHERALVAAVRKYDHLVSEVEAGTHRVLTHGEPHAGNTMFTADGWRLIDWDTAEIAPPERDLWNLDPGDGSVLRRYAEATGYVPRHELIELYSLRWDLTDLALFAAEFRREHGDDANTAKAWVAVQSVVHSLVSAVGQSAG
ncbi:aminoglycoside phosphotransferase family protein [Actinospica sp.]|uniref:aminoglycoside phosphotransferase family protein n=1 Tax=Actinospica sp. TaxID=1872142 RepID=UPI002B667BD5|nr:aminoglycoside phosphotransferase family protein [Actinospica sp.]HWG22991.1 aminoglycoside phosphotransferase family protein [Actinospica sp.]